MNLSYGSRGDEVKRLQTALNGAGYGLQADGIFGSQTQAAVRDYQSKNGLGVDGIVGALTQGKLYATEQQAAAPAAPPVDDTPTDYGEYRYDASTDSAYQAALEQLKTAQGTMPSYKDSYKGQMDDIYAQIMSRDKFKFDLNEDEIYQQYVDQYTMLGEQAMQDTMGQAAALTGGYGSTYAQQAGQQQYNAYLKQLGDIVPELYAQQRQAYDQEGQALYDQYAMIGAMRDDEYGRYQDALSRYYSDVDRAQAAVDTAYNRGYQDYLQSLDLVRADQQKAYGEAETLLSAGIMPSDAQLKAADMDKTYAQQIYNAYMAQLAAAAASGGGSRYSGKSANYESNTTSGSAVLPTATNKTTEETEINPSHFNAYMRTLTARAAAGDDVGVANAANIILSGHQLSDSQYQAFQNTLKKYGYST